MTINLSLTASRVFNHSKGFNTPPINQLTNHPGLGRPGCWVRNDVGNSCHRAILRSPFDSLKGFLHTTSKINDFYQSSGASPLGDRGVERRMATNLYHHPHRSSLNQPLQLQRFFHSIVFLLFCSFVLSFYRSFVLSPINRPPQPLRGFSTTRRDLTLHQLTN